MSGQSRSLLDHELDELQHDLLSIGDLVTAAVDRAMTALQRNDPALAREVIEGDRQINTLRYRIEEECLALIATQQPAASDLRRVLAGINMAGDLERMGDHAAGIAKTVLRMQDEPRVEPSAGLLRMADICRVMLQQSLESFRSANVELAQQVAALDDELDRLYNSVLNELLGLMLEHPRHITAATYLLWCAHNLERLGDRTTNIIERVIFMRTGSMKELNV
jgi:phosphate transport system protein